MALIDVIKFEGDQELFAWRYPSDRLKLGTQLIVNEGQTAVFLSGGQATDVFTPGTYTLSTGNLPILEKLINLPFGGDTPFSAQVWFVTTTLKRDLRWGTPSPIPVFDRVIGMPVSLRAFGRWGVRISDPRSFLTQIVGGAREVDYLKLKAFFIGDAIQGISQAVSDLIVTDGVSILQISQRLEDLSATVREGFKLALDRVGVELAAFIVENINLPPEELDKIQEVYGKSFEARELSNVDLSSSFSTIKSFEVMNSAAENPSDNGMGALLGAGLGLGAGVPLGQQIGQAIQTPQASEAKGESVDISSKLETLAKLLAQELITQEEYDSKRAQLLAEL